MTNTAGTKLHPETKQLAGNTGKKIVKYFKYYDSKFVNLA
jgi:hypothetical protein